MPLEKHNNSAFGSLKNRVNVPQIQRECHPAPCSLSLQWDFNAVQQLLKHLEFLLLFSWIRTSPCSPASRQLPSTDSSPERCLSHPPITARQSISRGTDRSFSMQHPSVPTAADVAWETRACLDSSVHLFQP